MPQLDHNGPVTSYFEFWPTWLMYIPVVLLWLVLAVRYRSLSLPLIANPAVPLSGMVGVAKSTVFTVAGPIAQQWILPWTLCQVTANLSESLDRAEQAASQAGLQFPFVGKPDIGCRGAGVKLLHNRDELANYLAAFPVGTMLQLQRLSDWDAEAGVFYVRHPDAAAGEITSLTLKYTPFVVGDGRRSLGELVAADPRAGALLHLYRDRHAAHWDRVLGPQEPYRLVFSASHCRGAVFRDAAELINTKLTQTLDTLFADIPGFYYGRLDIKFRDIVSLQEGRDFAIIEINGASSESINIWDRKTRLGAAVMTLLRQYATLFRLGAANRRRGHRPPGLLALIRAWRYEVNLVKHYPMND